MNALELLKSIFCDPEGSIVVSLESEGDTKVLHEAVYAVECLENRLKDAEEVIAFYADPDSWQGSEMVEELPDDQNIDAVSPNTPWHTPVMVCGKRARDYLKKYSEDK